MLKSATSDIISSLNRARSQTLASLNSSSYGVHFQSDKGIIFNIDDLNNETIDIITPAIISNGTLTLPVTVYFNRLSGTPSVTGTVTVSNTSYSKIITISATGSFSSS